MSQAYSSQRLPSAAPHHAKELVADRANRQIYLVGVWLEVAHLSQTVSDLRTQAREAVYKRNRGARPSDLTGKTNERSDSSASTPSLSTRIARQLDEEQFAHDGRTEATQHPWTLLAWVRRNRLYSAGCIATMLLVNAGIDLWQATTRVDLRYPSGQFIVEILISWYAKPRASASNRD